MNAAINRSGMPIANRGIEAIAGIESIDSLIDKKGATAAEIAKAIEKVSQMYMKALLSKPDVWVARSSFISYYKNYLKTNGMSTDIDWQTHEWNQEAMNYAQMMVDRQQNISDSKLAGSFMNSSDPWKSVTRKSYTFHLLRLSSTRRTVCIMILYLYLHLKHLQRIKRWQLNHWLD